MNTCRACLQKEADEYCSIYKAINQATLSEMFTSLTGLKVSPGDALPQCVCQECSNFIQMCDIFRKKCLKSDVHLRSLLVSEASEGFLETSDINELQCKQESNSYDEILGTAQMKESDYEGFEEDPCSGEADLCIEPLDVKGETIIVESTVDQETCCELYIEEVELHSREALDEFEDDCTINGTIECIESTQEIQQSVDEVETNTVLSSAGDSKSQLVLACCGCSGLQFCSYENLMKHSAQVHQKQRIITNIRPYECNICYKRFISPASLSTHQTVPYREKNFACNSCNARFCNRGSLNSHINSAHTRERKYVCDVCQKGFYTSSTMLSHRQIHGEKKYQCTTCSKKFLRISDLLSHQMTHSAERPYSCEQCEMRFKSRSHLREHQRVHTGERNRKCRTCGKGFATYNDRRVHELQHVNIDAYKCDYCDKTYGRNYKLQVHIRKEHTKERPYACTECPKRFFQRWEMSAHRRVDHGKTDAIEYLEVVQE